MDTIERKGEAETIPPDELIYLLVDIVSKNGNLLLDVGPEADGTIPPVQMMRLQALGTWLGQNGEAIYGTHPWKTAEGTTSEGVCLRFTQTDSAVYATMLGKPKTDSITLKSLAPKVVVAPGGRMAVQKPDFRKQRWLVLDRARHERFVFGVGPTLSVHPKHRVTRRDHRDRAGNFVDDDYLVHTRRNGIEAGGSLGESERQQEKNPNEKNGEKTNSHVVDLRG